DQRHGAGEKTEEPEDDTGDRASPPDAPRCGRGLLQGLDGADACGAPGGDGRSELGCGDHGSDGDQRRYRTVGEREVLGDHARLREPQPHRTGEKKARDHPGDSAGSRYEEDLLATIPWIW